MINTTSFDLNHRVLDFRGEIVDIYFASSLVAEDQVAYIIEGITNDRGKTFLDCINNGDVKVPNNAEEEEYALLTGNTLIKHKGTTYVIDTRQYPTRGIEEPETEKSVRGSKDGFNESLLFSVGLIRRRIRTMDVTFEAMAVGTKSKMDVCVCYLESKVDKQVLKEVIKRLKNVKLDDLTMSDRAIEEVILQQSYNPFPLVRYSERPDVVSTHIMHGKIAIICDTSSSVMMLPISLFDILEHVEEHRQTPLIGTFIRLLRFSAVLLSVYLVPVWMLSFADGGTETPYILQIIAVEIAIELLRLATIHTPTSLSNAMGVVAAVLLGEFAIGLGLFSEEILLFCALGNVCGFATPNYELSLTNKYVKLLMIVSILLLGMYGFIIFNAVLIIYLMTIKPFGYSYLYPLFPLDLKELWNFIIRKPKSKHNN
jgi:Bacillus/Clostridium GerA spore germination protein.